MKYSIQYDINNITSYVTKQLIDDANQTFFTFRFDETTTFKVKNQCDSYLQYWPNRHNNILNAFGSLFIGTTRTHVINYTTKLRMDFNYLSRTRMDGTNANLAFQ